MDLHKHRLRSRRVEAFALYFAAFAVLSAPLLQRHGRPLAATGLALTTIWAASLVGLGLVRRFGGPRLNFVAQLLVAVSTPPLGAALARLDGLIAWEVFVFLAPLPLLCAVFVREKVWITVAGALATVTTAAIFATSAQMPREEALRALFFVTLTSGLGINASVIFRRLRAAQGALLEERQASLRREAEEAKARAELERRSIESERMALIGRLAAGVAHEINNPLAFVRSNVAYVREELTEGGGVPAELLEALDESLGGVKRIQAIVSDLKGFARDDPEPSPARVDEAIAEAIRLASVNVTAGVEIVAPPRAPQAEVTLGRGRLVQILLNLILNAGDAVAAGGRGRIAVKVATAEDERVTIAVEDDGPGIAPEVLPRLFQPFFTTKPVGKGTGLGLWLSREYVHRSGGTIRADNRAEGGARFTVELLQPEKAAA